MNKRNLGFLTLSILFACNVAAEDAVPDKGGFSGFVNVGVGGVSVKSNEVAEFAFQELSDDSISSFGEADSKESGVAIAAAELSYTFADTKTQLYIGNRLEDYIRFDLSTFAGIRQEVNDVGTFGASVIYTALETEVWADPMALNTEREKTERTANGYRLVWDNIYGSELEMRYTYRDIEFDDEKNGHSVSGLSDQERAMLKRSGDNYEIEMRYQFTSDDKRHSISPEIAYLRHDAEGDAMAWDGVSVGGTYIYTGNDWNFVTNVYYASLKADEINPVFDQKGGSELMGASATFFYDEPFDMKNWNMNLGVAWFEEDSDITFYDSSISMVTAGMMYRF